MDSRAHALLDRDENAKDVLRRELPKGAGRLACELTLNVTNVSLDFEAGTATVDDDLDPSLSVVVRLSELVEYINE